ncbi:hypothetical protein TNCV_1767921 [Trichonephila clavipes]|nr:hypothetical protein TNCV_1767921 [Trichonephila clavipes]
MVSSPNEITFEKKKNNRKSKKFSEEEQKLQYKWRADTKIPFYGTRQRKRNRSKQSSSQLKLMMAKYNSTFLKNREGGSQDSRHFSPASIPLSKNSKLTKKQPTADTCTTRSVSFVSKLNIYAIPDRLSNEVFSWITKTLKNK